MAKKDMTLSMDSVLAFGKNKGRQVEDLLDDDPQYLAWLVENDVVDFDDEVNDALIKRGIV